MWMLWSQISICGCFIIRDHHIFFLDSFRCLSFICGFVPHAFTWMTGRKLISIEILTECMVSCSYLFVFRYLLIFHTPKWRAFFLLKFIHICSEIFQYAIRASKWYFDITLYLHANIGAQDNKCCDLLCRMLADDSTYIQWNQRCHIDLFIRLLSSIMSGIYMSLIFTFYNIWLLSFVGSDGKKATLMTFASMVLDWFTFIGVVVINKYYYKMECGVTEPFVILFETHKYKLVLTFSSIFVLCALTNGWLRWTVFTNVQIKLYRGDPWINGIYKQSSTCL